MAPGVNIPFTRQGYQHGAERIKESEGNGHDDAVHEERINRALRRGRPVSVSRSYATIISGIAIVPIVPVVPLILVRVSVNEGVGVFGDGRLREVEAELVPSIVLSDPRVYALRVEWASLLPCGDPGGRAPGEVHVAAVPALAVEARDVGGHNAILNPRARKELEARVSLGRRERMARPPASADGDVAGAVGVEDEDVGVRHDGAGSNGNPGVTVGDRLHLEIDCSFAGLCR